MVLLHGWRDSLCGWLKTTSTIAFQQVTPPSSNHRRTPDSVIPRVSCHARSSARSWRQEILLRNGLLDGEAWAGIRTVGLRYPLGKDGWRRQENRDTWNCKMSLSCLGVESDRFRSTLLDSCLIARAGRQPSASTP